MTLAPALAALPERVDAVLARFLHSRAVFGVDDDLRELLAVIRRFVLHGGKRLRPALCYWAWQGTAGVARQEAEPLDLAGFDAAAVFDAVARNGAAAPPGAAGRGAVNGSSADRLGGDGEEAVVAGAALELFHCFALIHDDIIDASPRRRGRASLHEEFSTRHAGQGWGGDAPAFGRNAALLCGDLCAMWAEELLAGCGAPPVRLRTAQSLFAVMRAEAVAGEYLDLLGSAAGVSGGVRPADDTPDRDGAQRALRVVRLKTVRYSIVRPLQIGASLAGAGSRGLAACAAFGEPLGRAFQLRDDVLGVFGDPARTGKSVLDDLRQAKPTLLLAEAWARAAGSDRSVLRAHVGDPQLDESGAQRVREVMAGCGALAAVEQRIARAHRRSRHALANWDITAQARRELAGLADAAAHRSS